ncbi:MAG: hypothetical protein LBJ07_02175 [Actinomycetes bacterium]|jgi:uncharacterized membrane protein|nr:hypothetical protein [Actinomycetes bacterium]
MDRPTQGQADGQIGRDEFLTQLERKLKGLPAPEVQYALAYWNEYLDDAGPGNEATALAALGSPADVAANIIADYAVRDVKGQTVDDATGFTGLDGTDGAVSTSIPADGADVGAATVSGPASSAGGRGSGRGGLSTVWIIVLGLLASPIALPLAVAAVVVLIALLVVVLAVVASLFCSAVVLVGTGLISISMGLAVVVRDFATTLLYAGLGLVCMAGGLALFLITAWLAKMGVRGIVLLGARILKRKGATS